MLGFGTMIHMLSGNRGTADAIQRVLNRPFKSVSLRGDSQIVFTYDDGVLVLEDRAQSCCESRYMVCDDDLPSFAGASIVEIEIREAPEPEQPDYGAHEVQFLAIKTTKGEIVCSTHNEHNGYYGGFAVGAKFNPA